MYQPTLEQVKQEAASLGYECVLDGGFLELDTPDDFSVPTGVFIEDVRGIHDAWVWLQRQRFYRLHEEKSRNVPVSRALFEIPRGHAHEWERLRGVRGLFACRGMECLWFAVCPGCAPSVGIALQVYQQLRGVKVYWCPLHERQGREELS